MKEDRMVIVTGENQGRKSIVIGVTEMDLLHIKDAEGVLKLPVNGEIGENFDILIFYGETDEVIREKLQEANK
jgi:hypothetical protein